MPSEMQERIAKAFDEAEVGYRMELTRLVDGEQTYTLYILGDTLEFPGTDEAYDHVRRVKNCVRALAVMKAMLEPTDGMVTAGGDYVLEVGSIDGMHAEDRGPPWNIKGRETGSRELFRAMLSHEIAAAEEARRDQD
mgnify:CR=1 FL=1